MSAQRPLPPVVAVPTTPALNVQSITDLYDINENQLLGTGGFSKVVSARHKPTGEVRAVKIMERSILVGKKAEIVAHEKEILRRTRHPNIIHLHDCITTEDRVFIAMDLMKGDLFEYFKKRGVLREERASYIMYQLMEAVNYLHANSIIHRDIKPENILINDDTVDVKLTDFGFAKIVSDWNVQNTPLGTGFYIAPEIIRGIETNGVRPLVTDRDKVKYIDIWAVGVTAFVLLSGRPPFAGQVSTPQQRRDMLRRMDAGVLFPSQYWAHISEAAKDFILRCLTQDTSRRMTAAECLKHPWLAQAADLYNRRFPKQDHKLAAAALAEGKELAAKTGDAPELGEDRHDASTAAETTKDQLNQQMDEGRAELDDNDEQPKDQTVIKEDTKPAEKPHMVRRPPGPHHAPAQQEQKPAANEAQ